MDETHKSPIAADRLTFCFTRMIGRTSISKKATSAHTKSVSIYLLVLIHNWICTSWRTHRSLTTDTNISRPLNTGICPCIMDSIKSESVHIRGSSSIYPLKTPHTERRYVHGTKYLKAFSFHRKAQSSFQLEIWICFFHPSNWQQNSTHHHPTAHILNWKGFTVASFVSMLFCWYIGIGMVFIMLLESKQKEAIDYVFILSLSWTLNVTPSRELKSGKALSAHVSRNQTDP